MKKPLLVVLALIWTTPLFAEHRGADAEDPRVAFFATLQSLCDAEYEGKMTFPEDGQDSFANKRLVASFKGCDENNVWIPFVVGEDRSRTWVFTRTDDGLQLKHDHRHEDGTPYEVTNYGGLADAKGSALAQAFPADEFTAELIPEAATNVWNISFNEDLSELVYHLTRHGKPRFTAELSRIK